jgi:polygalacturonase
MRVTITDAGAIPDGSTLNTQAIQSAINACAEAGGGTVVVPPGRFVSGTLQLRSRVGLELEAGSVLVGSPNVKDYRESGFVHVNNHFSQSEGAQSTSLIYASGEEEVSIRGAGTIDFSSDAFFDFSQIKPIMGVDEAQLSEEQRNQAAVRKLEGPTQPIFLNECRRVEVSGVRLINAPSLTININSCSDVKVHHITIDDGLRVPISDGIHICGSSDVIISESVFTCGDDCVAITGVTNWNDVSERIIISNCTMNSSSAGVRIGYLAGKIRDVVISNLTIYNTSRGFTVFAGDEGFVENVSIQNIVMHTRVLAGDWWGKGEPLVIFAPECNGHIENVRVRGVTARSEQGAVIYGDRNNVREIVLDDWSIELSRGPNFELFGGVIDLQPAAMVPAPAGRAPWLYVTEAAGVRVTNVRFRAPIENGIKIPAQAMYENAEITVERDVSEFE